MKTLFDRRGAIAAASAVVMVVVLGFAGLAIDATRLWMVNARLKTAIDAAALVAARQISLPEAERNAQVQAIYWANFTQNGTVPSYLGATLLDATIVPVAGSTSRIQVNGRANVTTTLFSLISRETLQVADSAIAEREGTGLELAIVLDNTSSMRESAPGFASKLAAAQNAANVMLGILYGSDDIKRNLWVSVVPFARTINIGTANTNFLDTTDMPPGWNVANWSGCVEARRGGEDVTDIGPATAAGRFRPYFWPTTFRQVGWVSTGTRTLTDEIAMHSGNDTEWRSHTGAAAYAGAGRCTTTNAYSEQVTMSLRTPSSSTRQSYTVRFCRGANDWLDLRTMQRRTLSGSTSNANYNPMYSYLIDQTGFTGNGNDPTSAAGPNSLCETTPLRPLTASRATVQAAINAITAPAKSGGTTIVTGMQGAWYTLSPAWRNWWPGAPTSTEHGALPLAYNTRNMNKAVVILTDGENNWQPPYTEGSYTVRDSHIGTNWFNELMYNAYGRRTDYNTNTPGTDIAVASGQSQQEVNAENRLGERFTAICNAMKAQGIRIYVVGFEVSRTSDPTKFRNLLQGCATSSDTYFEASAASELQARFTEIANQLASLRLVE